MLLSVLASPVAASPWTLPQHDLVISSDFSFARASREYLNDGSRQVYSVDGQLQTTNLALSLRYGFTDRFEMELRPNFKQLSYEADAVLLNTSETVESLQEARGRVVDFDSSIIGAADMDMAARYNVLKSPYLMATLEGGVKLPLGYEAPQGTFASLSTLEVRDDATLGDGQIDVRGGLLLGSYLPITRTFARVDAAYNHRFSDPGDQVLLNGKIGQYATDHIIIVGGVRWAKTVTQGTPIGKTAVDLDPGQSAQDFDLAKVDLDRDLFLDRDFTIVEVGLIAHFERVEFRVAWEDVIDGRNYADLRTLNFGFSSAFPGATRPPEDEVEITPSSTDEKEEDTEVIEEVIIVPLEDGEPVPEDAEVIEEVIIEVVEPDGTVKEQKPEEGSEDPLPPPDPQR